jgi:WD40 repeat protein
MSNCVVVHKVGAIAEAPRVFEGHRSTFFAKAALKHGIVASGSQDSLVYLWSQNGRSATLGSKQKLYGHLHEVNDVAFGIRSRLLSCSDDASVLVWKI